MALDLAYSKESVADTIPKGAAPVTWSIIIPFLLHAYASLEEKRVQCSALSDKRMLDNTLARWIRNNTRIPSRDWTLEGKQKTKSEIAGSE